MEITNRGFYDGHNAGTISGQQVTGAAQALTQPASGGTAAPTTDTRIRLDALDTNTYATSPIMQILTTTGGVLFPYTPSISFTQGVDYTNLQLVHSNTDYPAYTRTPSVTISVSGKFTVQNWREGQYALAVIHFFRSMSKSYFGENDPKAGLPPPILVFSGYGNYMFNYLRVILKSHSWTFDDSVDYVPIQLSPNLAAVAAQVQSSTDLFGIIGATVAGSGAQQLGNSNVASTGGGIAKLPSIFTLQCELTVVQTPTRMRNTFNFQDFANGALMQPSTPGWI